MSPVFSLASTAFYNSERHIPESLAIDKVSGIQLYWVPQAWPKEQSLYIAFIPVWLEYCQRILI